MENGRLQTQQVTVAGRLHKLRKASHKAEQAQNFSLVKVTHTGKEASQWYALKNRFLSFTN